MKMNRHRTLKLIGSMLLTVAMSVTMIGYVPQTALAEGGKATVKLANADGLDANTEFSFEMYKVGHFDGPGLVLEDNLKGSKADVDFPSDSEESEEAKSERMVASAAQLAKYIDDNNISLKAIGGAHTLKPGESFTQAVTENGLYLVRSNTVRDITGVNYNWTPQPVYVMVLNGDSAVTISNDVVIKILRTPVQFRHRVLKTWVIPNAAGDVKPSAIYVNIRYGGQIIDVVKLTSASAWTYDWTSEEVGDEYKYIGHDVAGNETEITFTPDKSKPYWSVDEILDSSQVTGWDLTDAEKKEIDELGKSFTPKYSNPKTVEVTGKNGKTEQIEELEINNPYNPPPTPEKPKKGVKTGDYAHLAAWAAGLVCACVLLVILWRKRQKRD
jgi:hypothetical protein